MTKEQLVKKIQELEREAASHRWQVVIKRRDGSEDVSREFKAKEAAMQEAQAQNYINPYASYYVVELDSFGDRVAKWVLGSAEPVAESYSTEFGEQVERLTVDRPSYNQHGERRSGGR